MIGQIKPKAYYALRGKKISHLTKVKRETDCGGTPPGGNNRARTCDPLLVRQMLSQLSYAPIFNSFSGTIVIIAHQNTNCKCFLKKI